MDTVHLSPSVEFKTPSLLRWPMIALAFMVAAAAWWGQDLWRVATAPRWSFDLDDSLPRDKLLKLALFAFAVVLAAIAVATTAYVRQWMWFEWVSLLFVLSFLYAVATGIRLLR
jgi:hypothetical protein